MISVFFGLVQPKFIFGLVQPKFIFGLMQPKLIFGLVNSRQYFRMDLRAKQINSKIFYFISDFLGNLSSLQSKKFPHCVFINQQYEQVIPDTFIIPKYTKVATHERVIRGKDVCQNLAECLEFHFC